MEIKKPKLIPIKDVLPGVVFTYQTEVFYKLDGCDPKYNVLRFKIKRIDHLADHVEVQVHNHAELRVEG